MRHPLANYATTSKSRLSIEILVIFDSASNAETWRLIAILDCVRGLGVNAAAGSAKKAAARGIDHRIRMMRYF
jgi:hypothetical protein